MAEFTCPIPAPPIPDDVTIPQFFLSTDYPGRPVRPLHLPFFIDDKTGRAVGFQEVNRRTYGLANALTIKYGVQRGDVVCLFSPNDMDYAVVVWAVHTLGAIITPANPNYTADELAYQLIVAKANLIIAHPVVFNTALSAAKTASIPEERIILLDDPASCSSAGDIATIGELVKMGSNEPENYKAQRLKPGEGKTMLAFLSFSSGTTGKPKGVAIPHHSVIANVLQMAVVENILNLNSKKRINLGDKSLAVLPFFHIYGLVLSMHFFLFCGVSLVIVPKFIFSEYLKSITRHRITHLHVVPPQVVLLCKDPLVKKHDLSSLKFLMCGAAPLSAELLHQLSNLFPDAYIGQGYGLTESCTTLSYSYGGPKVSAVGSSGKFIPGVRAKVVRADGTLAAEGEPGELVAYSPSLALGYYNNEEATRETFINGWLHTGDEVMIKNNEVYILDRLKEILKVRGFQVAPAELEGHLLLHPDVVDACVVGVPDDYSGEAPRAYIVLDRRALDRIGSDPARTQELKDAIAKHVSDAKVSYKRLTGGVEFIDAIPKNPSGKILRRILREKAKMSFRTSRDNRAKL